MEQDYIQVLMQTGPVLLGLAGAYWGLVNRVSRMEHKVESLEQAVKLYTETNTREHDKLGESVTKVADDLKELEKANAVEHAQLGLKKST